MEDDDPFFACDDDFVWPVLSSSDELPYCNVVGVTMCSVPPTPESNPNDKVQNLGFSDKRELGEYDREYLVKLTEDSGKDVVKDVKGEDNNKKFRIDLTAKSSLLVEDDSDETEFVKEDEKIEALGANSRQKASKLLLKSSLMVEDGNDKMKTIKEGEKKDGFMVNLAANASKLEANSRLKVEVDNIEIETVKKDEVNKGCRVNLAAKELKLRTKLEANSRLKVESQVVKEEKKKEGIRVKKLPKQKSTLEGKSSLSAMECLIEVLKHTCKTEEKGDVDILATVTRRGMRFPLPRGYGS